MSTVTSSSDEILCWTSQDPRESQLFNNSWGIIYRFHTEPDNRTGQSVTTLWRAIRANKEDRVAKLEWAPNGGLGRAIIGKNTLPMADLVRRDPRNATWRIFNGPDGLQYRWRPDPATRDILLLDPQGITIAFVHPTTPLRYANFGDVYAELHFVRGAGAGVVMHPPLMDTVTVTAMLYRFVSTYNL
ncbi:hypothetical protein EVG20_g3150 [Dentipellis fragilis]|uniref:DUF6593 domain-containing protein n=1 Tax=Dentipellis fragilis TaxID=205917 RepID=A0A4Y9Z4M5_9AGAM|nr:hypothetical protein EVG20_g3150 [Dentipellis fragilis]